MNEQTSATASKRRRTSNRAQPESVVDATTLDYSRFPHLIDSILENASPQVLFAFRLTSKELCERVDNLMYRFLCIKQRGIFSDEASEDPDAWSEGSDTEHDEDKEEEDMSMIQGAYGPLPGLDPPGRPFAAFGMYFNQPFDFNQDMNLPPSENRSAARRQRRAELLGKARIVDYMSTIYKESENFEGLDNLQVLRLGDVNFCPLVAPLLVEMADVGEPHGDEGWDWDTMFTFKPVNKALDAVVVPGKVVSTKLADVLREYVMNIQYHPLYPRLDEVSFIVKAGKPKWDVEKVVVVFMRDPRPPTRGDQAYYAWGQQSEDPRPGTGTLGLLDHLLHGLILDCAEDNDEIATRNKGRTTKRSYTFVGVDEIPPHALGLRRSLTGREIVEEVQTDLARRVPHLLREVELVPVPGRESFNHGMHQVENRLPARVAALCQQFTFLTHAEYRAQVGERKYRIAAERPPAKGRYSL